MSQTFQPGDVVRPKSGGPEMTIEEIGEYNWGSGRQQALCKWFEGKGLKQEAFRTAISSEDISG